MKIRELTLLSGRGNLNATLLLSLFCLALLQIISCAAPSQKHLDQAMVSSDLSNVASGASQLQDQPSEIEQQWGVKILRIRLTTNGYQLDFRFHVTDTEKASPLIGRRAKPYVIDEASGIKLSVPSMPKVGSLRAKGNEPDRDYFVLFSNPNGIVKKGSKVTVIADDFKVEHLIVE